MYVSIWKIITHFLSLYDGTSALHNTQNENWLSRCQAMKCTHTPCLPSHAFVMCAELCVVLHFVVEKCMGISWKDVILDVTYLDLKS